MLLFLAEWKLVEEKTECSGSEINKGKFETVEECASECKGEASMFAFGTNDFGKKRCYDEGCKCLCETSASEKGSCEKVDHDGYRLFRYSKGDYHVFLR